MTEHKIFRNIKLHVTLNQEEMGKVNSLFSNSMCQNMSEYIRKCILTVPMTFKYRNRSVDAAIAEMILLRNELSTMESSFNQLVKELPLLDDVAEIISLSKQIGSDKEKLFEKVNQIKEGINKLSDLWSQTSDAGKVLQSP
jgi:hypothetical protein